MHVAAMLEQGTNRLPPGPVQDRIFGEPFGAGRPAKRGERKAEPASHRSGVTGSRTLRVRRNQRIPSHRTVGDSNQPESPVDLRSAESLVPSLLRAAYGTRAAQSPPSMLSLFQY